MTTSGRFDESLFEDDTPAVRTVGAKNLISLPIVELAAFWLFASSDHGQPYINVAQVSSHRLSKPNCDAGRNHRASATGDRYDEKGKWIQTRLHSSRLPRGRTSPSFVADTFCRSRVALSHWVDELLRRYERDVGIGLSCTTGDWRCEPGPCLSAKQERPRLSATRLRRPRPKWP